MEVVRMAKTEEDMSGKVSRLPKMFNYVIGVVAVVISFLAWWYPKTDIGGNQVSSTNAGSPVVTTLVTTTSPMISTTLPQSTSTITPLKTATAVLAASETDLVEGKSLKASDLFRISSDGSPNIKSMTTSVCTSAKGLLTFTTSGVCRVQVIVVETSRFKSISKKFLPVAFLIFLSLGYLNLFVGVGQMQSWLLHHHLHFHLHPIIHKGFLLNCFFLYTKPYF